MRLLSAVFLLTLGAILVAGCSRKPSEEPPRKGAATPSTVSTIRPERKALERIIEQPAHIEAYEETPIVVRIAGYIRKIDCDIGTHVKGPRYDSMGEIITPGQVLAELWVPEMEVELKQKDELVKQADAEVKLAEQSVKASAADEQRVRSQFERFTSPQLKDTLSKEELEESRLGHEVSKAKLGMAKAEVGVRKARLEVAKQNRDYVKAMLQYAELRAPFDGIVTRRNVHTGHYVQPGASGAAPFVVARTDKVRVVSHIPEVEAAYVQDKMKAKVRVQMLKGREFIGQVTRTSWSLAARERTLRIEIDLPSEGVLVPGTYAYVSLEGKFADRLTVPASAVMNLGDQACCFLLEQGKARRTPVQLGLRNGSIVEVLRKQVSSESHTGWENFTGQETIVSGNLANLTDGQVVQVERK
jgi:HlyD family secretion protein